MTFDVIATGSNGNAVVLNKNILIDCGVSWKAIKPYAVHHQGTRHRWRHYEGRTG